MLFLDFVCSISMLGKLNPLVQAPSFSCHVHAMVKSSTSSSTSKSTSSSSNSSSSNSSSSCSEVKKPTARATVVVPSSLSRCHNSRVITATEYDPRDGTWVYSTTDKAVHNRTKAKSALLQNRNKFRHFCCKLPHGELCHEHQRSRRAGLMLDVIQILKLYQNPAVVTRSFTKSLTTYCRTHEQSSVRDSECCWLACTCSFSQQLLFQCSSLSVSLPMEVV